jgi:hypothetical protein
LREAEFMVRFPWDLIEVERLKDHAGGVPAINISSLWLAMNSTRTLVGDGVSSPN